MRLKNKVAIVTGASKGIGKEIACLFAKEGASVILAARNIELLKSLESEIKNKGGIAYSIRTDMQISHEIKELMIETFNKFNKIDILVNNAGLPMFGYPIDSENSEIEKRYNDIMQINLKGYWYAARYALPFMKKNKSANILNISSVRGKLGLANETAYCAAKGAVNMFTKSLAVEVAPYNIRANTIIPGAIQVDIGHWVLSRHGKKNYDYYLKNFKKVHILGMKINQPLKVIGRPKDVAYGALYLCSDEARFVSGAELNIDGGLLTQLAEPSSLNLEEICEYYNKSKELKEWLKSLD